MKQILIAGLILIAFSGLGMCGSYGGEVDWNMSGTGTLTYPNEGWVYLNAYDIETSHTQYRNNLIPYTCSSVRTLYVHGSASMSCSGDVYAHNQRVYGTTSGSYHPSGFSSSTSYSGTFIGSCTGTSINMHQLSNVFNTGGSYMHSNMAVYISPTPFDMYTISGNVSCVTNVSLYTWINDTYVFNAVNTSDYYLFDIVDNETYKLVFSNGHEYPFTVNGANIGYDYSDCIYTTYQFEDRCGNLIKDSEGFYIEKIGTVAISAEDFYAPSGKLEIESSASTSIYISTNTFVGNVGFNIDPVLNDTTYNCTNNVIAWGLKVIVVNQSNIDEKLVGATVRTNQSCYCASGFSVRQKKTVSGAVDYNDMSLQDSSLWVYATGYKILDENSTGFDAFLSGRVNFSSKTWIVKLAPSDCENTSEYYETSETTKIFFKNEAGQATSQIDDTDSVVYLHYHNNNSDGEDMTLRFESSSTHTYFTPEQSWNVPHGDVGRKTIVNADFTPFDYSYRAVMYNSSIYGWNLTIPLTVRDANAQTEQNYQNLSTFLWFRSAKDGKIDHRTDMKVGAHACSNNTTLMIIDVELYKDGTLLCYKNLTKTLLGDDHTYTWSPSYDYESGSVYTAYMYGYDRTLLETEVVECITDTTTRKNKITIIVKDRGGSNIYGGTVFLEGYGQTPCNSLYYASFEGIENGEYRYKASKSGYTASGWNTINISDDDESVSYVLSQESSSTSGTSEKMANSDLKGLFFPFMYCLLIMIVIGGLRYVLF